MCQAYSCIVHKDGRVFWKAGLDSHDAIMNEFKLTKLDRTTDPQEIVLARVEITPDKGYLYPEDSWTLKIDEKIKPIWWLNHHEIKTREELSKWKDEIYSGINLEEARHPIDPRLIRTHKLTQQDIANLKKWDSVRTSVWDSAWDSVRDPVGASVGDSVWVSVRASVGASVVAYIGSLFKIDKWQHIKHEPGVYPFQPAVDLWKRGFVPSFDGKTWRLHQGKDMKIVYELKK